MKALTALPAHALGGEAAIPGDKSISHRALILGALAVGETTITGLLQADDVRRTAAALVLLGARHEVGMDGTDRVWGRGVGGLAEPDDILDLGNAGTGVRLLMGAVAAHGFPTVFTGDRSLRRRPMARVTAPLKEMGARIIARSGGRLPLTIIGTDEPIPISYRLPVPSAQVKSAILLAGLSIPGRTEVIEPVPTRDHTERLLTAFGAEVSLGPAEGGARRIRLTGQPELTGRAIHVPGDPSSAAFALTAGLLVPESRIATRGIGYNSLRCGLFETLVEMGANLRIAAEGEDGGEPVADVTAEAGVLKGVEVEPERAPRMIDEYPILAVAAACAEGRTVMRGLGELRVKESDRLATIADGLTACGVEAAIEDDALIVTGCAGRPPGGGRVQVHHDHRIAMAFLILGLAAEAPVTIDDATPMETSFPGFVDVLGALGARFEAAAVVAP